MNADGSVSVIGTPVVETHVSSGQQPSPADARRAAARGGIITQRLWSAGLWGLSIPAATIVVGYAVLIARAGVGCAVSDNLDAFATTAVAWLAALAVFAVLAAARAVVLRSFRSGLLVAAALVLLVAAWLGSVETIAGHGIECSMRGVDWPPCLLGCAH